MAASRKPLDHWQGGSLSHPMSITALLLIWPEDQRKLFNKVWFQRPHERINGIWVENLLTFIVKCHPTVLIKFCKREDFQSYMVFEIKSWHLKEHIPTSFFKDFKYDFHMAYVKCWVLSTWEQKQVTRVLLLMVLFISLFIK